MKLLILCTMVNSFDKAGFYNNQEIGFARGLAGRGHTVEILRGIDKKETNHSRLVDGSIPYHETAMFHLGAHGYLDTSLLPEGLDAVIAFSDQQLFLAHVYRYCQKHGILFVMYTGTTFSSKKGIPGRISDFAFRHSGMLPVYRKSQVLVKTIGAAEQLRKLGVPNTTLAAVGLDVRELHPGITKKDREEAREKLHAVKSDTLLLSVMRYTDEKRPLALLSLFSSLKKKEKAGETKKHFRLVVVGSGERMPQAKAYIREHSLESDVMQIERVPYDRMWQLYTATDYYLNMNPTEIFGMSVMEAVYYKTCVVARTAPGPSSTLAGLSGHRLCDSDEEMQDYLLEDPPDERDLEESSRKILQRFSWDHTAEIAETVIRNAKQKM